MPAPPDDDRFSVMQSITTLVAQRALSSSREAAWLDHVQNALKAISTRRKSQAIENAIATVSAALGSSTADAAFPSVLVPDEELAVAVLGVLVAAANSRLDSRVLPIVRRFPPRLRTQITTLISAADGSINTDHADLLSVASVGALDATAFYAATGKGDLLKRMKLPQAAARIMPAGCGPISRFSAATFRRWSNNSQLFGLLDARSLQQRRQIGLCSRIASATLAHVRDLGRDGGRNDPLGSRRRTPASSRTVRREVFEAGPMDDGFRRVASSWPSPKAFVDAEDCCPDCGRRRNRA